MTTRLAHVPARHIVRALSEASARWCDATFAERLRAQAAVCERTGYSAPVVAHALDELFGNVTAPALEATIASELGSPGALDGLSERPGRPAYCALPVGRVCVVSSRTTIGVALWPAIFALCAKNDVVVKDREDHLIAAFLRTAAAELSELADACVAQTWHRDEDAYDLATFDAVVAFGTAASLAHMRERVRPSARFIAYGPAASVGYIAREVIGDAVQCAQVAAGLARDMLLYDGEGCLSLHAVFVERSAGATPGAFCDALRDALDSAGAAFPPGRPQAHLQAAIANARNVATFRASQGRGGVVSGPSGYVAVMDAPLDAPPAFLPRVMGVHAVDGPAQALHYLREHTLTIEAIALAGGRADIVSMALASGASRIARFGELQRPPLAGNHGGRPRIADFVRAVPVEL